MFYSFSVHLRRLLIFRNFVCSTSSSFIFKSDRECFDYELDSLDVYVAVITILNVVCVLVVFKYKIYSALVVASKLAY